MPSIENHTEKEYRQFRHDLTHYITQIMLATADKDRNNSIPLRDEQRQTVRTYIHHLRDAINRSDLPPARKEILLKKLDELERELERRRVRVVVVVTIVMAILSAPGDLASSYDSVVRITNNILRVIGQAKEADNEQRHISHDEPIALIAPRQPEQKKRKDELDDEIPF